MKNLIPVVGGVFYRTHPEIQVQLFRKKSGSIAGFFEFPGGKIEPGEAPESALAREIYEELGVQVIVQDFIAKNIFEVSDRTIELSLYLVELNEPEKKDFILQDHDQILWISERDSSSKKIAPGDLPLMTKIFAKIKTKI